MYVGLQEVVGIPSSSQQKSKKEHRRAISREYIDKIKNLASETKIASRPITLKLLASPFQKKFKKPSCTIINSQSGDSSPPLYGDD